MAWAHVENGKVKQIFDGLHGVEIDGVKHPAQIFGKAWSDEDRKSIGIMPVAMEDGRRGAFDKPTGEYEFRIDDGKVSAKLVYRTAPIDQVKGRIIKDIRIYADNLKETQFSKEDRTLAALNLAIMEGEDRENLKASVAPKLNYINAVIRERDKRLRQVEDFKTTEQLIAYDWKDGWPFPEE